MNGSAPSPIPGQFELVSTVPTPLETSRSVSRVPRLGVAVWLTAPAVVFVGQAAPLLGSKIDDAYIFARYARNFLRYGDIVWNQGEGRIEGISSWLWFLVYVAGQRLGDNPLLLPKVIGITAGVVLVVTFAWQVMGSGGTRAAAIGALAFLVISPALAFYAASGMDHIAWCAMVWLYLLWISTSRTVSVRHMAVAAVAILMRPEGFLLFVPALAVALSDVWIDDRGSTRSRPLFSAAAGVGILFGLLATRHALFGRWLPNAAAAKHYGGSLVSRLVDGALYLGDGVSLYLAVPLVAVAMAIGGGASLARTRPERRFILAAGSFIAVLVGFILVAGGDDTSAFGRTRLITPAIAPAAYLLFLAFSSLAARPHAPQWILLSVVASLVSRGPSAAEAVRESTGATNLSGVKEMALGWASARRSAPMSALSQYLRDNTPAGQFIAVPWAGLVPWETDLPTIDLLGLNDPHIARTPLSGRAGPDSRYDAAYVLARRPYFICENFRVTADLFHQLPTLDDGRLRALGAFKAGQRQLLREPQLRSEYEVDAAAPVNGTCFRLTRSAR